MLNETPLERIWFVVSPQNPFKTEAGLLNEYHRLHLIQLAIGDNTKMRASDIEFSLPKPSYTSVTLAYMQEKYPEYKFSIIMGSDSFQNLHKWKNADVIIKNYPVYVYQRPGFDITDTLQAAVTIVKAPLLQLSATEIRQYIRDGKSIRYMVPDAVREEIERGGYYR